jgi:undecaprenyl-diphosphatase
MPGVSRSGSTIAAALYQKVPKEDAFTFSFLLSIPAIIGAFSFQLLSLPSAQPVPMPNLIGGFIIAAITGFFSIKLLHSFLNNQRFYQFGYYCLSIGIITLLYTQLTG